MQRITQENLAAGERAHAQVVAQQQADQEARDKYVTSHPELREPVKAAIHEGKPIIGMTESEAEATLEPYILQTRRINRDTNAYGTRDQWALRDGRYLYFSNGILESMQTTQG